MDKSTKEQQLIDSGIKEGFTNALNNVNGSKDIDLNASEATTAIRDFTKNQLLIKNNTSDYVDFIEEKRLADIKLFNELENKAKTESLTNDEIAKQSAASPSVALSGEEYFTLNAYKTENSNKFIADNPEKTQDWLDKLISDWAGVEDKVSKSTKYDLSKDQINMASSLQVMGNEFPGIKKAGFNAVMFAANPVGFLSSKVISTGIQSFLKTETGKGLVEKANEAWTNKFGDGVGSNRVKKGLAAFAMVGAVAVLGMAPDEVSDLANTLTGTLDAADPDALSAGIESTMDQTSPESVRPDNTPKGAYNPAGDAGDVESTRPDNTPRGAYNPAGDAGDVESTRPDNTPKGAYNPAGDAGDMNPTDVDAQEVWPESVTVDKSLELIAKDLLPADAPYSDIKELTMKIAEHNNLADADVIMKGMELDIPTPEQLEGIELKEFKIESMDDLKNLDKLPYGSELTPDEVKAQIKDVLKNEFPGQEMRIHETMAYVNQTFENAPDNQPVFSMEKLDFDKLTEIMHGDNKIELIDEQESPYSYKEVVNNEMKNNAVDYDVKTPEEMTSDEQESPYSYKEVVNNEMKNNAVDYDAKTPEQMTSDEQDSPYNIKEVNDNEKLNASLTAEEAAIQKLNGGTTVNTPPVDDTPQYMTNDAGRVNFDNGDAGLDGDVKTPEEAAIQKLNGGATVNTPPVDDTPQYMTNDAGRVNFDNGDAGLDDDVDVLKIEPGVPSTAQTAPSSPTNFDSKFDSKFESKLDDRFVDMDKLKAEWDQEFNEKAERMVAESNEMVKPQSEFTQAEKSAAIDKFEDGGISFSEKSVSLNGHAETAYSVNGINIDKANMQTELRNIIEEPSSSFQDKFGMSKAEAVTNYLESNPDETVNMLEGNKPESPVQKQEDSLLSELQNEEKPSNTNGSEETSNRKKYKPS